MSTPDTEWDARKILLEVLEVDTDEYTPDQGMPPVFYKINDAQLDYLISSRDTYWKERVANAQDEGYRAGYAVAETISHMDYDDALQCLEEYKPTPITKDNLK